MAFNSTVFVFSLALKLYCLLWTGMPCYLQYMVLLFQGYHNLPSHHHGSVVNCRGKGEGNREAPLFRVVPIASHCNPVNISTVPALFLLGTDNIHSLKKGGGGKKLFQHKIEGNDINPSLMKVLYF